QLDNVDSFAAGHGLRRMCCRPPQVPSWPTDRPTDSPTQGPQVHLYLLNLWRQTVYAGGPSPDRGPPGSPGPPGPQTHSKAKKAKGQGPAAGPLQAARGEGEEGTAARQQPRR